MRIALRADAGVEQGSGHVMRCLTLGEGLLTRGHEVVLHGAIADVPWLEDAVEAAGVAWFRADRDHIDIASLEAYDAIVVDSYRIPRSEIEALERPVLAIVDGDLRGIRASLYLDQNLGAELAAYRVPAGSRVLAGPRFALVRDAILAQRRSAPWVIQGRPRVLLFLGGTDPQGVTVRAAAALFSLADAAEITVVVTPRHAEEARARAPFATIIETTPRLPELLGAADLIISAAGTSAWDVCALGVPSVLVAVVSNQQASLAAALRAGLCLGIDVARDGAGALDSLTVMLESLLRDERLRERLSSTAASTVDGLGKDRVAEAIENLVLTGGGA